jgi:hypothetical protein
LQASAFFFSVYHQLLEKSYLRSCFCVRASCPAYHILSASCWQYEMKPKEVGAAASLKTCICEVLGSNFFRDTGNPDWRLSLFSAVSNCDTRQGYLLRVRH